MSEPSLFPAAPVPSEARAEMQLGATFLRMALKSFASALQRPCAQPWEAEAIQRVGGVMKAAHDGVENVVTLLAASHPQP